MNNPRKPQSQRQQPIDPLLQQRLQQLGGRRAGAALPPPTAQQPRNPQYRTAAPTQQQPRVQQPRVQQPRTSSNGASADANARIAALAAARGNSKGPAAKSSPSGKRAKPAAKAKLASLGISAISTIGLAAMFAGQSSETSGGPIVLTNGTLDGSGTTVPAATVPAATVAPTAAPVAAPGDATPTTVAQTVAPTVAPTAAPASGAIVDGTYLGGVSQNRFGVVQVQVVYTGGQITDVQILQYPDGDRRSLRISQQALPMLIDEALTAQSAQVDTIGGATYTSRSYRDSLQSAIDAAKAASGITG